MRQVIDAHKIIAHRVTDDGYEIWYDKPTPASHLQWCQSVIVTIEPDNGGGKKDGKGISKKERCQLIS